MEKCFWLLLYTDAIFRSLGKWVWFQIFTIKGVRPSKGVVCQMYAWAYIVQMTYGWVISVNPYELNRWKKKWIWKIILSIRVIYIFYSLHKTSVSLGTFSFSFEKQYALKTSLWQSVFETLLLSWISNSSMTDTYQSNGYLFLSFLSYQVLSLRTSWALESSYLELRLCEFLFASLASKPGIPLWNPWLFS